jgi:hypothetical protein
MAADRRRIPGPPSSYPALPFSSHTPGSSPSSQTTKKRTRNGNEPRKICPPPLLALFSLLPVLSELTLFSLATKSGFLRPGVGIHRNSETINPPHSLHPRTSSTSPKHALHADPPTQHHLLPPPLLWGPSSPHCPWPRHTDRTLPRHAFTFAYRTHVPRALVSEIGDRY